MGDNQRWALPNGLLPNEAASVIRGLDEERWKKAEERTAELIVCIQPNLPSEQLRNAVADYVQRLITKCFPCQVFTFGSVPLKTYLPDGDIDLSAFCENQTLKDTWAHQVRDMLESEERNENAEFRVKEVQYIQAEVKIIKCLVENIVVDISFNQVGGLCTLCFLEHVDHLIDQNNLFKRSIILIKAWCYYESRILGAHHGLISTYALETLVLYIFNVFRNSFAGPLEVLYRFLEFFSKFDWDNFCVSLWGPVSIGSLPDILAQPPRKDGEQVLNKILLQAYSIAYAVLPYGQENQGQPFVSKHFNVIDPLRENNNLGRSVSKGNFFRIRSAFAFGAKRLAKLLDCPKEDLYYEVNQFFMNTWERHGSGHRPDAPRKDLWPLRFSNPDSPNEPENLRNKSVSKRNVSSVHETQVDRMPVHNSFSSQHAEHPAESTSRASGVSTLYPSQSQKIYGNPNNSKTFETAARGTTSSQNVHNDKSQRSTMPDNFLGGVQGRHLFARTRSSPELTEMFGEASSQGRRNRAPGSGQGEVSSTRMDNGRMKNLEADNSVSISSRSDGDVLSVGLAPSHHNPDIVTDRHSYQDDSRSVVGSHGMYQEEQDLVNMMASSSSHNFNGQSHLPLNLASGHLPFPIPPSILASMGFTTGNLNGMLPTNIPLIETPWGGNMQFPQGLVPSSLTNYFPSVGLTSNHGDPAELGHEHFSSLEVHPAEPYHGFWHEQDRGSTGGSDLDSGSFEVPQSDDKQQSTSAGYSYVSPTRASSGTRIQPKSSKENRVSINEDHLDTFQYQDNRVNENYCDDRTTSSRSKPASHASSTRSKTSSESSWEGSSANASKSAREKRGRKTVSSTVSSAVYGKGKSVSEHSSIQVDNDSRDWNPPSTMGTEIAERNTGSRTVAPLLVQSHQLSGLEPTQTSGSDSLMPLGPVLLGPGSRQGVADNSGALPFAFYPTGPPVPFVTMLPVYNFPSETRQHDVSISHFSGDKELNNTSSDSTDGLVESEMSTAFNSVRTVPAEHKSDILNGDFANHLQNLQFGRLCQSSRQPSPLICPSPLVVPPVYLQGRFTWDGPGRPLSGGNMNLFTQLVSSYGPRLIPMAPPQSVSNRPANVFQHYADEIPRYRSGTGTYLPNPKITSPRDRHANSRRGNYRSYDRNDHHGGREGNSSPKPRAAWRNRNQAEKLNSRTDRLAASESRTERSWGSNRNDTYPSYQSQNGPFRSNSTQNVPANVAYGMYPLPAIPSVVMLYPYDQNAGYSPAEQIVGFSGVNETSQLSEGSRSSAAFEEQRFHGGTVHRSSPDQPSSPHFLRNYQLKDEDFPPLAFPNQGENDDRKNL